MLSPTHEISRTLPTCRTVCPLLGQHLARSSSPLKAPAFAATSATFFSWFLRREGRERERLLFLFKKSPTRAKCRGTVQPKEVARGATQDEEEEEEEADGERKKKKKKKQRFLPRENGQMWAGGLKTKPKASSGRYDTRNFRQHDRPHREKILPETEEKGAGLFSEHTTSSGPQ